MTRRPPRLFDPLDLATLRRAATGWDVLSLMVIAVVVSAFPVLVVLFGGEDRP